MRERLPAAGAATRHQKQWFREVADAARRGDPLALVTADTPHEILRTFDIPYVVSQWWASIVTAKRMAPAALAALAERGHPDDIQQYDALPFGSHLLGEVEELWGGLPQPRIVLAENSGDATRKAFGLWSTLPGTDVYAFERTAADPAPDHWWDLVTDRWEEAFGSDRLDLLVEEQAGLIEVLEDLTGKAWDPDRFRRIMETGNEQARVNRATRDALAVARPHPVALADSLPAVMVPQWHRGSEWGLQAARDLNQQVMERIEATSRPDAEQEPQRLRLMWVGRGVWGDLDLYEHVRREYGGVFVWSMYLAIAADGYERNGDDGLRALAARFVGLTDQLYAPPWSTQWYVKEARTHAVDAVVHLVADDVTGAGLITQELRRAGFPVLELRGSNADPRALAPETVREKIGAFLENEVMDTAAS